MGAGQSSDGSAGTTADIHVKTSYYELLGVERQATEEQLKKAYRRKALELHPDRNFGNEQEATKTFAEVQAAYEILSDPQERAWYDSHEAAILRGDDGQADGGYSYDNIEVTTADDLARVVRKFNSNVEFTDAPSGFYGFLSEQFAKLAKEEEMAGAWEDVDVRDWPLFGHKDDTHDGVVKEFYSAWTNFSTVKSFAWKDRYRLSEAPDRRIRRLMEKENNNLRQEAIREFNEAVRSFVLFVRKRDPRYQPSTQSEAERQQMLRDAAAAQQARARAANLAKAQGEVPLWAQARNDSELEESEEEEVDQEVIECVACSKTFKSEKQFEAHERSKKHQKAVYVLQKKMKKDDEHLHLDEDLQASKASVDDWEVIGNEDVEREEQDDIDELAQDIEAVDIEAAANEKVDVVDLQPEDARKDLDQDDRIDTLDSKSHSNDDGADALALTESDDEPSKPAAKKMGKAAQKRAKKAAAAVAEPTDNNHKCAGCNAAFPSRTQLFQHIKKHGHAALKADTKSKKKR